VVADRHQRRYESEDREKARHLERWAEPRGQRGNEEESRKPAEAVS